jgi:itaconate CoA-transferase
VDSEAGPIDALLPPFNIDSVEPVMGAVPALGQHTETILVELGYDATAIAAWQQAGVV